MENRRLLLAAFLSAVILILWNQFLIPKPPVTEGPQPASESSAGEGEGAADRETATDAGASGVETTSFDEEPGAAEPEAEPEAESAAGVDFGAETVVAAEEGRFVLENDRYRAELSNRGAVLVSFHLKRHTSPDGEPLELVRRRGNDPYPFALVAGGARSHPLNQALFTVSEETDEDGRPLLRFRHRSELGTAEKVFRWTPEDLLDVGVTVADRGWGLLLGPGLQEFTAEEMDSRWTARQVTWKRGTELETLVPKKVEDDVVVSAAGLDWAAFEDNFFLTAVIPREGLREILVRPVVQRAEVPKDGPRFLPHGTTLEGEPTSAELMMVLEASGGRLDFLAYLGAKQYRRLNALPYGLEATVHWGSFIGLFARPLYFALEWTYEKVVPNYGWAIVLVTCLIKILFFPLTFKSQMSMMKMQELNPKVQAIKNKYRGKLKDKQGRPNIEAQREQNDEVMKVYREAGVNPVSGCFPILLQMPVFFAFYRLLSTAVELRGAEWLAWIHDLSAKDPYYVLPLVMGITSIGMQKMTPQSPDPMQRRMMQMMPIMFTVFAFAFPSGLVLYWATNNVVTMGQQALLNRFKRRQEANGETAAVSKGKA